MEILSVNFIHLLDQIRNRKNATRAVTSSLPLGGGGGSNGVLRVTTRPLKAPFSLLNDFEWFLRRISGLLIEKTN